MKIPCVRAKAHLVFQAPSTPGYFLIRNFFFKDSKIFPSTRSVFKSNLPIHTHPKRIRIHSSAQNKDNRACAMKPSPADFTSHLENLFHGKELGSILLRHPDKKIPGFGVHTVPDSFRIQKYPLWKAYSKSSGFTSEFAGYVWTEGVSGKKKLRIQEYPYTCGRGLIGVYTIKQFIAL